jgi:hypothetical protein
MRGAKAASRRTRRGGEVRRSALAFYAQAHGMTAAGHYEPLGAAGLTRAYRARIRTSTACSWRSSTSGTVAAVSPS